MEQCYDCIGDNSIVQNENYIDHFMNNNGRIVKMKLIPEVKNKIIEYINKNRSYISKAYLEYNFEEPIQEVKKLIGPVLFINGIKNFPKKSDNPTDYVLSLLLTMTSEQIHKLDENFLGFDREEYFIELGAHYDEDSLSRCSCGKKQIKNVFVLQNRETNIQITVGCECIDAHHIISEDAIKKGKKQIELEKHYLQCIKCKKFNIDKKTVSNNLEKICDDCIRYTHNCKRCNKLYESQYKNPQEKICIPCKDKIKEAEKKQKELESSLMFEDKFTLTNDMSDNEIINIKTYIRINDKWDNPQVLIINNINNNYYYANRQIIDYLIKNNLLPNDKFKRKKISDGWTIQIKKKYNKESKSGITYAVLDINLFKSS